jgi:hypothetical protein
MNLRIPLLFSLAAAMQIMTAQTAPAPPVPPVSHPVTSPSGSAAKPEAPETADAPPIPAIALQYSEGKPIPGAPSTALFMPPVHCSTDGVPLIAIPRLHDFAMPDLYLLDPGGARNLTPSATLPGLYDVRHIDHFAADSSLSVLVRATRDDTTAARKITIDPATPPRNVFTGAHHDFLLRYDLQGNFKEIVDLPVEYQFRHVAPLPDDSLLAIAYDRANAIARLLLLDPSGKILRSIEIPSQMQADPKLKKGETGDQLNRAMAETSLSSWHFAVSRHKVLLYQAHTHAPVLEIGAAGATREVPIQAPAGYSLDSIYPATSRWLFQFRKESLDDSQNIDTSPQTRNYVLYEVDPYDGSLRRRFDLPATDDQHAAYFIGCEQDGALIAITMQNQNPVRATADLGH